MLLTRLNDGQIGEEHECTLNWTGKVRIDLVDFGRAAFLCFLVLNDLG